MQVTGIEVVKRPAIAATGALMGEKVELTYGDSLRVNVSFDYRGLQGSATLYGAIGNRGAFGFGELIHGEASVDLPQSPEEFTPCMASVDIPITSEIGPGTDYGLYCKIMEVPGPDIFSPEVLDVIDIVGIPPTYELLQHTIYPYSYVYDGPVEDSVITFQTDPFTPSAWAAEKVAAAIESETEKRGGRVTELKVYVDKSPLLWTTFRVEISGTPLGGAVEAAPGMGVGVGIPIWVIIVILALALALLIAVITWAIKTITKSFTHEPLSEEIKKTWSRETLLGAIGDFEIKLERPPRPPEELNGMSDQELRDYCDHMAEEIVPPELSLVPILVLGGVVIVVGAGAAYALTAGKK